MTITAKALKQRVSIVLLTYNCQNRIERTIKELVKLGVPIIAVDNASDDDTVKILQHYEQVIVRQLPKNIGAAGRNVGVDIAETPYVAFCDDDGYWERDGLKIAADLLDQYESLGLVNARILVGDEQRLDPISEQMANSPLPNSANIPGAVILSFMGGSSVVRKIAWQGVGGYDERFFMGGEEETVGWKLAKAGWHMRYREDMVAHHYPSLQNAASMRDYGIRNTIWNAWLHRPFKRALGWTCHVIASTPKNRVLWSGLLKIIPGFWWVWRNRSVMSPELEAQVRALEVQRRRGDSARQFGVDLKQHKHRTAS